VILVDTSVWIDHLHRSEPQLVDALSMDQVCTHTFVVQELALGRVKSRGPLLESLRRLRSLPTMSEAELLTLTEAHTLWGRGLSLVDAHLLGSLLLSSSVRLWTRDKQLRSAARQLGLALV